MYRLFEVHTNFKCNTIQNNDTERLHIKFRKTREAILKKKFFTASFGNLVFRRGPCSVGSGDFVWIGILKLS